MNIKPIKTQKDYNDTLQKIETLMSAKPNTPHMDELELHIPVESLFLDYKTNCA